EVGNRDRRFVQLALLSSLAAARVAVAQGDPGHDAACSSLGSFVAMVEAEAEPGGPLTPPHGTSWRDAGTRGAAAIACGALVEPTPPDPEHPPGPPSAGRPDPPAPRVPPPHSESTAGSNAGSWELVVRPQRSLDDSVA